MKNQLYILRITVALLFMALSLVSFASPDTSINYKENQQQLPPSVTNITICNNQLPYHWNGLTCLVAGSYTAILTGSNGADSTAILNLSVNNVGSSISNVVICDNQLPYQWNGQSYSGSGTFSVTLTSGNGCDSVPILSLTVNHVATSTTIKTVCSNLLPFIWNGNSYNSAGSYPVTLTSVAGCDSIATLVLNIKPVSTSITNVSVCANQLPYHWNGNTYPVAGTFTVVLPGSNGCDSIAKLVLTTKPVTTSTTNITVCSNEVPYLWNGHSYTQTGNYPVNFIGSNGCDSIATLSLSVKPLQHSNTIQNICSAQLPFHWNGNTYPVAGNYSVTLVGAGGCDSIADLSLAVVPVLTSTINVAVCNSELPYTWNGNSYSVSGNYTASFITPAGCDSIATLNLNVETPQLLNGDQVLCESQLPFNWHGYIFTSPGTQIINPPIPIDACHAYGSFTVSLDSLHGYTAVSICNNQLPYSWHGQNYITGGSYTILLPSSTGGCDTLQTLDLSVGATSTSITNISICTNQVPYSWNGHNYNVSGTYTEPLTNSAGCDSIAILNLHINSTLSGTANMVICNSQIPFQWNGQTYTSAGSYTVTLTSSGGCDSIVSLNLAVQPFITSTTTIVTCTNQLPYQWNGNTYPAAGSFTVTLPSSGGCDSIATLNLIVNAVLTGDTSIHICNIQLPFTWNGNAYNTSGDYSASLVTSGGCDSIATLHLFVHEPVSTQTTVTVCNNQLPYSWNGNSYSIAGVYPVTLTGAGGCDSIAILDLVVTDILTSTTNVTVCNAQLPYQWNGNSYLAPGTYSVTLASPGGCDSVPILSLTVVPYFTSSTDVSICSSQLPYQWNGQSFSAAGNYSDTLPASSGCDSIATLHLLVNTVDTTYTSVSVCGNQLPYSWNGNSYNTSGTFVVILSGTDVCDSIVTLNLDITTIANSITDITICNDHLPYNWNGNNYTAAGNYTVTLAGSSGCDSVATLILHTSQVSQSTSNISVCSNQLPYTWNGQQFSTAGQYSVSLGNTAGCDSVAVLNLTITNTATSITDIRTCSDQLPFLWNGLSYSTGGIYSITLTSAGGCDSSATLQLGVLPVSSSFLQHSICINQLPFFWNGLSCDSTGNYTVTLTNALGCDSIATLKLLVNALASSTTQASVCSEQLPYSWNGQSYSTAGTHAVTLVSALQCDSIATLSLTINPSPASVTASPATYCQFDPTVALTASANASNQVLWYTSASGANSLPAAPIPSSAVPGLTTYYVSQQTSYCQSPRSPVTVRINPKPALGPDRNERICFGSMINLDHYYQLNGLSSTWTYNNFPQGNTSSISLPGEYELIAANSFGCIDTAKLLLDVQPKVIANAGLDDNAEPAVPYQLSGSGNGSYSWSPANLLNNFNIASPLATIHSDTRFILEVKDEIGCKAYDTVNLRVLNGPTFYVPDAFTPNGDGQNDIFRPTYVGISKLDFFRIYNRFGELVFQTSTIGEGWNGMYKGVKQNTGNFVWFIQATDRKGLLKVQRGNVILIR